MVKIAVFDLPNPERENYLSQQPLCEHSMEVAKALVVRRLAIHGLTLVSAYHATPKWRVISRWKQRIAMDAARTAALAGADMEEDYDDT